MEDLLVYCIVVPRPQLHFVFLLRFEEEAWMRVTKLKIPKGFRFMSWSFLWLGYMGWFGFLGFEAACSGYGEEDGNLRPNSTLNLLTWILYKTLDIK